jgi:hypothetical protein
MRSFFRALERRGAEYLIVSGQAAVLHGGATFSEDFDLWVRPSRENMARTIEALRDVKARVYKLTPPLVPRYWSAGHAFHFRVGEAFVDLMPRPPRVGAFGGAKKRALRLDTDWGRLPVVAIEDLVEIKKTRRRQDYPVITRLALIRLRRSEAEGGPERRVLRFVLENVFGGPELDAVLGRWPRARAIAGESERASVRLAAKGAALGRVEAAIEREIERLAAADRRHWQPIIRELRALRSEGVLVPEGSRV